MRTFKDTAGREWYIDLTVGEIKRIRRRMAGLDLLCLLDGDPPLSDRLRDDLELMLNVVYAAIEPQALNAGVSDEEFGQALDGDTAAGAISAMWGAVADFFRCLRPAAVQEVEQIMTMRLAAGLLMIAMEENENKEPSGVPSIVPPEPADSTPTQ